MEQPIAEDLDVTGWDLRKALRRLGKSNPAALRDAAGDVENEPLSFTPLHRLEFRNAVRLMVHRRHQRGEVDLSPEQARRILRDHENDLDERVFITHRAIEWTEALRLAERLSAAHTASEGFRSLDLLHVGSAPAFRCGEFYSFDIATRRMAALAGLKVLPAKVG